MERKLVKQGRNALTVTLPSDWVKFCGLSAGDTVNINPEDQRLTISAGSRSVVQETSINVTGEPKGKLWGIILARYMEGYDVISIKHDNPALVQDVGQWMLGMIIEEHTPTHTLLRSLSTLPEADVIPIIRRVGHMFLQQAVMLEEVAKSQRTVDDLRNQEMLVDQAIYYCLRYINKYLRKSEAFRYFLLCSTIELAIDQLRYIATYIDGDVKLAKKIRETVQLYNSCLFANDFDKLYHELRAARNALPTKLFVHGLVYQFIETIYNNLGYLVDQDSDRNES